MLEGLGILITGGASGIGRAAAELFAGYGARVAVADIDLAAAQAVVESIEAVGGSAIALAVDTSDPVQVDRMVDDAVAWLGRLDAAFNNVGVAHPLHPVEELPLAVWERTMAITATGTLLSMQAELRHMVKAGGGAIVNTASNSGTHGTPMLGGYGASKAAVINLTKTVAVEYASRGIRANAICPGVIDTPPIAALAAAGTDFSQIINAPMGRIGTAKEVAELAAWLCSGRSSYVTGQAISIDGGQSATP
ncbi:SDR family NAD(P)-dependent oxidoreductase [Novosphingobium lentum]|uniref:SDR family NAD(P)-dependent oxidoreductase n=1 Tax=Novosphingobium lentum TaxID=145287 RepID=UPI0008362ACD|nr:SDR family NAD(P)-dependent oxidoreductase [Novosphingobium lentum]